MQLTYIYVAVKKLAELKSEGEKPSGDLVAGQYPGTALRIGSRGQDVQQMQFWLNEVAQVTPGIPGLASDGIFGPGTQASVEAFQSRFGLSVDGVVGQTTWAAIYREYTSLVTDETPGIGTPGQYPGTALAPGSRGNDVKRMQFWLRIIARNNTAVPDLAADGIFGAGTERSVRAFQTFYGLTVDGIVGRQTWDKIYEVYTNLINGLMAPNARPGTYPGSPLRLGSSGQSVKEIQYYLYLLSAYYVTLPVIAYDGVFGSATQTAVREWQRLNNLTVDGVIGAETWASIYNTFSAVRAIDGPVNGLRVFQYPGQPLQPGSQGDSVRFAQFMLSFIGAFFDTISPITALTGNYDDETVRAVRSFQTEFELPVTGIIDEETWNRMVIVYLTSASETGGQGDIPDGEYGGSVLVLGSTGLQVFRLQTYINGIAARYCVAEFTPATGIFTVETLQAVQEFQKGFGLPVTGFVDRLTWEAIYNFYAGITPSTAEEG